MEIDVNHPLTASGGAEDKPQKCKTIRFTVSLPEELLEQLDNNVIEKGYASRSEFIRDLIREQIVEDEWQLPENEVTGVMTIIYDLEHRDLAQKIFELQQNVKILTICSSKIYLDHHNCLENIIVKGQPKDINLAALTIGGLRGIKLAKLTKLAKFAV